MENTQENLLINEEEIISANEQGELSLAPETTTGEVVESQLVEKVEEVVEESTQDAVETTEEVVEEGTAQTEQVEENLEGLTEDEILERELNKVNAELKDLDAQIENVSVKLEVKNLFDTQEGADEVGIGLERDGYGREILEDVFENRLRMSTNGIKLAYSKVKNTVLSFKGTKQYYDKLTEYYIFDKDRLIAQEIHGDSLYVYLKTTVAIAEEYCPANEPSDKAHKDYGACVVIKRGKPTKRTATLEQLVALVEKVMIERGAEKKKVFVPTPYAERYPVNPDAVLRGSEEESPVEGMYDGEEYDPIDNELTRNIIIDLMGEDFDLEKKKGYAKLEALRQQAETIRGAVALTEPIIYFYSCGLNRESKPDYLMVTECLNDKFLGKLLPQQYEAIAENSERVEEFNLIAIERLLEVIKENEKYTFALPISCRTFARKGSHQKLLKLLGEGVERLIFVLDGNMLASLGKVGIDGVDELKGLGAKIMINYSVDVGVFMLTDYAVDYLRIDARYYKESDKRRTALLDMITGYAKLQGIPTVASGVDETKQAKYFLAHGIDIIEGFSTGEPKRTVQSAVKESKKLPIIQQD